MIPVAPGVLQQMFSSFYRRGSRGSKEENQKFPELAALESCSCESVFIRAIRGEIPYSGCTRIFKSIAWGEWVRAPMEMKSTPASA